MKRSDLDEFVACYNPKNRHDRTEIDRFKSFTYDELTKREKVNLDIFWLKDEALEESANPSSQRKWWKISKRPWNSSPSSPTI